jgi:UDP-N-acetylmuramoylalanine--D-glutamate ligase
VLACFGYGKTIKAISSLYRCDIFDDKCKTGFRDEYGNRVYPSSEFDGTKYEKIVVTPGIAPHNKLVKNSLDKVISDYDLIKTPTPFSIWVSGTNGKTTTTQMINHLLPNSISGGNIGTPVTLLDRSSDFWVIESSSFTLFYTKYASPNIYALLPISDDHLSWHGSFKEYEYSKLKPLTLMSENSTAIIPSKYRDFKTKAKKILYKDSSDLARKFDIDIEKIEFKEPFLLDALIALAVSSLTTEDINYSKLNEFRVDKYKLEEFRDSRDRVWINDSKATNIDATIQAIKHINRDKTIFLILGGDDKGANLTPLFELLKEFENLTIFAIGRNRLRLLSLAKEFNINYYIYEHLSNAIKKIDTLHTINSTAILSPAAASLDQFKSYQDRGEIFSKLVLSLK